MHVCARACISCNPPSALLIKEITEKNETFSAAGSARTTGLVSGTGTAQLCRVSYANVTTQLLQTRAIAQWLVSSSNRLLCL